MANSLFARIALVIALAIPSVSWARVDVFVSFAPPPLPVYVQPPLPAEGYIWLPGYWAYDDEDGDYYWVPGTWARPPAVGLFWTPGYWAWSNGIYIFNPGYWGPHVGFYGGLNYGYGYNGYGYHGGYWNRGAFYYNRSINNFGSRHVTRYYSKPVVNKITVNNISYNGGHGGVNARPNAREQQYAREKHIAPTAVQRQHVQAAISNREQRASVNQGRPPIAATDRAGQFKGSAVVPARAAGGPLPDRSRQNDDRRSQDGRPGSASSSGLSTSQNNPVRDNGAQVRTQPDRPQDQPRLQQQRNEQVRQQREQSQREFQRDSQRELQRDSQRDSQRYQQQRELQGQQQQREQQMQQMQRERVQREQQVQQQREQQVQRDQQALQRRESQMQQVQPQRTQQAERAQQMQQQREHSVRQMQPRQEAQQPVQREQRAHQDREQKNEQKNGPQRESRRDGGRD